MRKLKRIVSLLTILCMLMSIMPNIIVSADSVFGGGSGTEESPYLIKTEEDFVTLAENVNGGEGYLDVYFKLDTDNLNVTTPIGKKDYPFKGTFDGGNKTVNLAINSNEDYIGLFGSNEGTIKNVKTSGNVTTTGYECSGAVVGLNDGGTIINCSNSAEIFGNNDTGGICGRSEYGGKVKNCYNSGTVTGSNYVGGISGYIRYTSVASSDSEIKNCYNSGTVTGSDTIGGISGTIQNANIFNCVNNGKVTGSSDKLGGISGTKNKATIENSYFNSDLNSGIYDVAYDWGDDKPLTDSNCAVTAEEIVSEDVILSLNWYAKNNSYGMYWQVEDGVFLFITEMPEDVQNVYGIVNNTSEFITVKDKSNSGETVNVKKAESDYAVAVNITVTDENEKTVKVNETADGWSFEMPESDVEITAQTDIKLSKDDDGAYLISSANDMMILSKAVENECDTAEKTFVLKENISLSTEGNFKPVGNKDHPFKGTFDGGNKTVSLEINSDQNYIGIIGYNAGTVKNVNTAGNITAGGQYSGAVVGYNDNGIIANCSNSANIIGSANVGGIVGNNTGGAVTNCSNSGNIDRKTDKYVDAIGGIIGLNKGGTVRSCSNSGNVTGDSMVGGICGYLMGASGFDNCYNSGTVTGGQYTGGIAGEAWQGNLKNCVNNGAVKKIENSEYAVGGITGTISDYATVENSYFNSDLNSGIYDSAYDKDDNLLTDLNHAVTAEMIVSKNFVARLNMYAKNNSCEMYWQVKDGVLSMTKETVELPYYIINNASNYIKVDDCSNSGETVSVKKAVNNYGVATSITVKDSNGKSIKVNETADGWSFEMPKSDVTITAKCEYRQLEKDGDTYILKTAEDFMLFSIMVSDGNNKINARVETDGIVDLTDYEVIIGFYPMVYMGEFDGNGVTVKTNGPLFGSVKKAVIKNINSNINSTDEVTAGIVGAAEKSKIVNCTASGQFSGKDIGGIVYQAEDTIIANCTLYDMETPQANCFGGIAYYANGKCEIYNCANLSRYVEGSYDYAAKIATYITSETVLENNFYIDNDDCYDVKYNYDTHETYYKCFDENSAVSTEKVDKYYIQAKQNYYITENNTIKGETLKKWSVDSFADEEHPEIYQINQTDIVNEALNYGAIAGEKIEFKAPKDSNVKITDNKGNVIETTLNENLYSFTMPAENINVSITMEVNVEETKEIDGKTYAIVKTAEEFVNVITSIANGNGVINVYLANDITVENDDLKDLPVNQNTEYEGTFDGANHTITYKNWYADECEMIDTIGENGVVKNLTVDGVIEGSLGAVGIALENKGIIYNCANKANISGSIASGFVAMNRGTIFGCINYGNIQSTDYSAAIAVTNNGSVAMVINSGFIGYINGEVIINSSSFVFEGTEPIMYFEISQDDDEDSLKEVAAAANATIEMFKIQAEAYPDETRTKLINELNMYSVNNAMLIFADKENSPYFPLLSVGSNFLAYKAGEKVEIDMGDGFVPEGTDISEVIEIRKHFIGDKVDFEGKGNTISFTMPENVCRAVFLVKPELEKDNDGYYLVGSLDDLMQVKSVIESGNTEIKVRLNADIEGYSAPPIGSENCAFNGVFDGNGHSITVEMGDGDYYTFYGLFTVLDREAVVKNLTINGRISVNTDVLGSVAGANAGAIVNCVNNAELINESGEIGGIAGGNVAQPDIPDYFKLMSDDEEDEKTFSGLIKDCTNNGKLVGWSVAGIAQYMINTNILSYAVEQPVTIENCVNNADISGIAETGGIVVSASGLRNNYGVVKNCVNNGNLEGDSNGESECGGIATSTEYMNIDNCVNNGDIASYWIGGVIGCAFEHSIIKNCENNGNVNGVEQVGGIVGYAYEGADIMNSLNNGDVEASDCGAAGIIGGAEADVNIMNCYNSGNIIGNDAYSIAQFVENAIDEYEKNAITNTYYLQTELSSSNLEAYDKSEAVENEKIVSGEISYKLNKGVGDGFNKWSVADGKVIFANDENTAVYKTNIDENIKNGTVTADKEYVKAGENVRLTIQANEGYTFKKITGVTVDENNTFVMPENDVTIGAVFTKNMVTTEPNIFGEESDDGKYNVKYFVPNGIKYCLICAEYTDGVLTKITTVSSDKDTNNGEIEVEKGKNTKIMLWDSLSNMKPLCDSYVIK